MVWLLSVLVFSTTALFVIILYELVFNRKRQVMERLTAIKKMDEEEGDQELQKPFIQRVFVPAYKKFSSSIGNLAPVELRNKVEQTIIHAGTPWNLTFNTLAAMQLLAGLAWGGFVYALLTFSGVAGTRLFLWTVVFLLIGGLLPFLLVYSKARKRQVTIQRALPDMLDLLLVTVEAGLAFDMAMKRVAEKMPGELSQEMKKAIEETSRGRSREDALRAMVKRTGVADLSSFVSSIIQSEKLGSNIGNTLRVQAATMRQRRKQRAEEMATKAPVKMLFPLIFFIFPAIFVVILGPAAIRLVQFFMSM